MIQHLWTVPCRVTITDQQSNNISLIEVLEELTVPPPNSRIPLTVAFSPLMIDLVTLWSRGNPDEPEFGNARSSLVSPAGETMIEQVVELDLRERRRFRTIGRFLGLPLQQAGTYAWRVEKRQGENATWEEVARVPLEVHVESPAVLTG